MDLSKLNATEVAAVIAVGGVAISGAVAYVTASRSVFVNAITASRTRWLENVRKLIAEFREVHLRVAYERSQNGMSTNEEDEYRMIRLAEETRITLGRGQNEGNVLLLLEKCTASITKFDDARDISRKLADHSRWLFESEWQRIKREAAPRFFHVRSYKKKRDVEYAHFCANSGYFEGVGSAAKNEDPLPVSAARL